MAGSDFDALSSLLKEMGGTEIPSTTESSTKIVEAVQSLLAKKEYEVAEVKTVLKLKSDIKIRNLLKQSSTLSQPSDIDKTLIAGRGADGPLSLPPSSTLLHASPDGTVAKTPSRVKETFVFKKDPNAVYYGHNRVISTLGEGGMATVFKCIHDNLEVPRAVKILRPILSVDNAFVSRFIREAKIAASLRHNNIVSVFNVETSVRGEHFIEMEYVEGVTLAVLLTDYPTIPIPVVVSIAYSMGKALAYAHKASVVYDGKTYNGLVHRDIKPANIIISKEGYIKITDFGIARAADDSSGTQTGSQLGTYAYMSPEQIDGAAVNSRSDIFSFGITLYHLTLGVAPFSGTTAQMCAAISAGKYKPPSAVKYTIPAVLDRLICACLVPDQKKRIQSMDQVVQELRSMLGILHIHDEVAVIHSFISGKYDEVSYFPLAKAKFYTKKPFLVTAISLILFLSVGFLSHFYFKAPVENISGLPVLESIHSDSTPIVLPAATGTQAPPDTSTASSIPMPVSVPDPPRRPGQLHAMPLISRPKPKVSDIKSLADTALFLINSTKNYDAAVRLLSTSALKDPYLVFLGGLAYFREKNYTDAIMSFKNVAGTSALVPDSILYPETFYNLGMCYSAVFSTLNNPTHKLAAINYFNDLIKKYPSSSFAAKANGRLQILLK